MQRTLIDPYHAPAKRTGALRYPISAETVVHLHRSYATSECGRIIVPPGMQAKWENDGKLNTCQECVDRRAAKIASSLVRASAIAVSVIDEDELERFAAQDVYVTATGKTFHYTQHLRGNFRTVSRQEAIAAGLLLCEICFKKKYE